MDPERYYKKIRDEQKKDLEQRIRVAVEAIPELAALESERLDLFLRAAKGLIEINDSSKRISEISLQQSRLLKEHGFPEDQLSPRYACAECKDTGWVGYTHRPCRCRLLKTAELDPSIGINNRETFSRFNDAVYASGDQRDRSIRAKQMCERYADSLPDGKDKNLVILGGCGLGKSYLGNAIAYRALEKGCPARRITAFRLIQDTMNSISEHLASDTVLYTVPLLVLDDLGSEPLIPNVSEETLLALLDQRQTAKLNTVVISNLSAKELQERYGERIFSRLFDKSRVTSLQLTGTNLRWGKAGC